MIIIYKWRMNTFTFENAVLLLLGILKKVLFVIHLFTMGSNFRRVTNANDSSFNNFNNVDFF